MRIKKTLLLVSLAILLVVMASCQNTKESNPDSSSVFYSFNELDGTLTIFGEGDMRDCYSDSYSAPWKEYRDKIQFVNIVEGITSISHSAFASCSNLRVVAIPGSVKTIENGAFRKCYQLEVLYIEDLIDWCDIDFGDYESNPMSFADSIYLNQMLLTNLVVPEGVTEIKEYAFYECKAITSVKIPKTTKKIGFSAFRECENLKTLEIEEGLHVVGSYAFERCMALQTLVLPEGVQKIENGAFDMCMGLKNVQLPSTLSKIGARAFRHCSISTITIPDNVNYIEGYSFEGCSRLKEISLPSNIERVESYAFKDCEWLEVIRFDGTKKQWKSLVKGENWDENAGEKWADGYVIACIDGSIG